jgi:prophage regulatory protein
VSKRILRRPEVLSKIGLATTQLYELIKKGEFPQPIRIGPRAVGFLEAEVDEWIDERLAEREYNVAKTGKNTKPIARRPRPITLATRA